MNRLERVRQIVDQILREQTDLEESRCGFVHLYGVSQASAMLALKRGLDPELCATAGMLHDIWSYKTHDTTDHAVRSAVMADEILRSVGEFTREERAAICAAISTHSLKEETHDAMAEVLKDADVFQHHLYNTAVEIKSKARRDRLDRIFRELSIR